MNKLAKIFMACPLIIFGNNLLAGQIKNSFQTPAADSCAFFQLEAGSGVPTSNFNLTRITVTYYQDSNCSALQILGPANINDNITINLPKTYGFDKASCALVAYRGGGVLQPGDLASGIGCISIQAFGTDSGTTSRSTNIQNYPVTCSGTYPNVQCLHTTTTVFPLTFN